MLIKRLIQITLILGSSVFISCVRAQRVCKCLLQPHLVVDPFDGFGKSTVAAGLPVRADAANPWVSYYYYLPRPGAEHP